MLQNFNMLGNVNSKLLDEITTDVIDLQYDLNGIATKAWQMACQPFQDCSPNNLELMKQLNKWYVQNDRLLTLTSSSFFNSFRTAM